MVPLVPGTVRWLTSYSLPVIVKWSRGVFHQVASLSATKQTGGPGNRKVSINKTWHFHKSLSVTSTRPPAGLFTAFHSSTTMTTPQNWLSQQLLSDPILTDNGWIIHVMYFRMGNKNSHYLPHCTWGRPEERPIQEGREEEAHSLTDLIDGLGHCSQHLRLSRLSFMQPT